MCLPPNFHVNICFVSSKICFTFQMHFFKIYTLSRYLQLSIGKKHKYLSHYFLVANHQRNSHLKIFKAGIVLDWCLSKIIRNINIRISFIFFIKTYEFVELRQLNSTNKNQHLWNQKVLSVFIGRHNETFFNSRKI